MQNTQANDQVSHIGFKPRGRTLWCLLPVTNVERPRLKAAYAQPSDLAFDTSVLRIASVREVASEITMLADPILSGDLTNTFGDWLFDNQLLGLGSSGAFIMKGARLEGSVDFKLVPNDPATATFKVVSRECQWLAKGPVAGSKRMPWNIWGAGP